MTPYCFTITPKNYKAKLNVQYTIVGVNEDNVEFTVSYFNDGQLITGCLFFSQANQDGSELFRQEDVRDDEVELENRGGSAVELCWRKLDHKTKKLNFMVTQTDDHLDKKAGRETVDDIKDQLEELETKLDQISQNIQANYEVEVAQSERKNKTQ